MIKRKILKRTASAVTALAVAFSCVISVYAQETDAVPSYLHSAYKTTDRDGTGSGANLYHSLKITGDIMPEEQIFSVNDIENISQAASLGLLERAEINIDGNKKQMTGINLYGFLKLCGLPDDAPDSAVIRFYGASSGASAPEFTKKLSELKSGLQKVIIAFAADGAPLGAEDGGPVMLCDGCCRRTEALSAVYVSSDEKSADPYYGLHLREPLDYMQDSCIFTVNYIDSGKYTQTDDSAVPFAVKKYSMREIESLIIQNPRQTHGNYFGMSGNEKSKLTFGLGGFYDYFEGIDMGWFLSQQAGLKDTGGRAVFYGRDNDAFAEIKDLSYFFAGDYSRYYLEIDNDTYISGVVPVIGVSKNGYPLLPLHDHGMEGNVDYNIFNKNAVAAGFDTKIGMVKNVSGPFIAGLPNLDGVYGGYRCETSGDCIRIDIYVDKSEYKEIASKEAVTGTNQNVMTAAQSAAARCAVFAGTAALLLR